ncbi:MAG: hypothetical protein OR994_06265 [Candidatus Poseidoniales archaeon]|nr:hypothetical protein [Candidatus Poseidoniales archaeon]
MSVGVLLAIDSTGSMKWVHKELCKNIGSIIQQFDDEGVPARFSLIGFRDYQSSPTNWIEMMDFETAEEEEGLLAEWLSNLVAKGGGNNQAESSMAGLAYGITEFEWPEVKRRVVAIFTDDFAHIPDYNIDSWNEVHEILRDHNIQQVHLFVDERHEEGYDELDSAEYDVIRHPLVKNDRAGLEQSIRKFVKVSSSGFGGDVEIIERDISDNPFDFEDVRPRDSSETVDDKGDWDPDANPFDGW